MMDVTQAEQSTTAATATGTQSTHTSATQDVANPAAGSAQPQFSVPEAYRGKGWTDKIKSEDDLWKTLDNAQSVLGKKYATPDIAAMSETERAQYYASIRPKDAGEYAFPEGISDSEKGVYGKLLHDAGITKFQGEQLLKAFTETTAQQREQLFSPEGLEQVLKQSFGDGYGPKTKELGNLLKSHVSETDWKMFDQALPNEIQGLVFRIVDGMQKAYGAKEGIIAPNTGSSASVGNVDEAIAATNKALQELARNPFHTAVQKKELMDKLSGLYKQKGNAA